MHGCGFRRRARRDRKTVFFAQSGKELAQCVVQPVGGPTSSTGGAADGRVYFRVWLGSAEFSRDAALPSIPPTLSRAGRGVGEVAIHADPQSSERYGAIWRALDSRALVVDVPAHEGNLARASTAHGLSGASARTARR